MTSTNQYLSVSSGHIDSLINYVLDVKPYHVKLSEIVEQYIFEEFINVGINEDQTIVAFLGADLLPSTNTTPSVRRRRTSSWYRDIISDGNRRIWPVPLTSVYKFASQSNREKFISGVDDDHQIAGLNLGVFNQRRWDGEGITDVRKNNIHQQESVDYFLSHGVYSFEARAAQRWKSLDLTQISKFADNPGFLFYNDNLKSYGSIRNIVNGNYEEWTLTCISDGLDLVTFQPNGLPIQLSVTGSISGLLPTVATFGKPTADTPVFTQVIGGGNGTISPINVSINAGFETWIINFVSPTKFTVEGTASGSATIEPVGYVGVPFNNGLISFTISNGLNAFAAGDKFTVNIFNPNRFNHPLVSFDFMAAPGELDSTIAEGDTFVITPSGKITIHPNAPIETWSLIKTNPIAITSKPIFTSSIPRTEIPSLEIHTRSLDRATDDASWSVIFGGDGTYTVNRAGANGTYSITEDLKNGCSFKNEDIHFTILTNTAGFYAGDTFNFVTSKRVENYAVFGSTSGWQANAKIGEWYWNGKIGFKIPKLEYFAQAFNSTIVTSSIADVDTWNTVISNDQILRSVSYQAGAFFTAGDNQIVGGSLDGSTWTSDLTSLFNPTLNEILIVVGPSGTIATSADAGATWINQASHTNKNLKAVTQIPAFLTALPGHLTTSPLNCIIVVGDRGTILTSINGIGWAEQNSGTLQDLRDIAWSNDAIIAIGRNGTILRSLDRLNWTPVNSGTNLDLNAILYEQSSNSFIIVGQDGIILRSIDGGLTWANLGFFSNGTLTDITFGGGKFVAVGPDGWTATSNDGFMWIRYPSKPLNSIAYGNGKFVAVGGKADQINEFVEVKSVHSIAEPSVYTITFTSPTTATVVNNLYGYRKGLIPNTDVINPNSIWEDEFVSFRLDAIANVFEYQTGDTVRIYLAPKFTYVGEGWYDQNFYENGSYDSGVADISVALLYNEEYFPLYHSHGSVIFKTISNGDKVTIDKATKDIARLRIIGSSSTYPELAAVNDWIPLEFRYYDRVVNNIPTSTANFSDLTTYIEAYLCSNPNQKVFSIAQPRYEKSNRNASALLTFDPVFFAAYLGFNTQYSLLFMPDESYGQRIRVKITENLRSYARIRLNINDIAYVNIEDSPMQHFYITSDLTFIDLVNVSFIEGGALPINGGYDLFPYDSLPYDTKLFNGVVNGLVEISPSVYDLGNPEDWIIPKQTSTPSISISDKPSIEVAGTSFTESLFIAEKTVNSPLAIDRLSTFYNFNVNSISNPLMIDLNANEYLITHNGPQTTPTLIIESLSNLGVYANPSPNLYPFTQVPNAISLRAFTFSLPPGFTAPFNLTIA